MNGAIRVKNAPNLKLLMLGLITRDAYQDWKHRHRDRKNPWDLLREMFQ